MPLEPARHGRESVHLEAVTLSALAAAAGRREVHLAELLLAGWITHLGRLSGEAFSFSAGGAKYSGRVSANGLEGEVKRGGASSPWRAAR